MALRLSIQRNWAKSVHKTEKDLIHFCNPALIGKMTYWSRSKATSVASVCQQTIFSKKGRDFQRPGTYIACVLQKPTYFSMTKNQCNAL